MIASSNNLYHLIKKSKVEVISVTQRYRVESMEKDIHRTTTYNFIKDLRHLVKSGVFNHIDWKIEQKSKDVLLLTSNELDRLCGTYLEVEITPFGKTTMQQVVDKLKETIFSKPVKQKENNIYERYSEMV